MGYTKEPAFQRVREERTVSLILMTSNIKNSLFVIVYKNSLQFFKVCGSTFPDSSCHMGDPETLFPEDKRTF